jgi:hypothetical protein
MRYPFKANKAKKPVTPDPVDAAKEEAANPQTHPERLRALAQSPVVYNAGHFTVLRLLAANPNTPPDVLSTLVASCPDEFLTNPAAPLLLLEDPGFYDRVSTPTLKTLLVRENLPGWLVRALVAHRDPGVSEAARLHILLTGEKGEGWREEARTAIFALPSGIPPILVELLDLQIAPPWMIGLIAGSRDAAIRRAALTSPSPATSGLRRLIARAAGTPDGVTLGAEPSPDIAPEELERLARGGPYMRHLAARHPNTSPETLARLAADPDTFIRVRIARNPSTPPEILNVFARSETEALRIAVARNPATPGDLLALLMTDAAGRVRAACVRHPRTMPDQLKAMAYDADEEARIAVARHPNTPPDVLIHLAQDDSASVRRALERRDRARPVPPAQNQTSLGQSRTTAWKPYRLFVGSQDAQTGALLKQARDPRATLETLEHLARRKDPAVAAAIAMHPRATTWLLRQLFQGTSQKSGLHYYLLLALSAHRNTPVDVLEQMVSSDSLGGGICQNIAGHPRLPELSETAHRRLAAHDQIAVRQMLRRVLPPNIWDTPKVRGLAFQGALSAQGTSLQLLALATTPQQNLAEYARSPEWRVRMALALNPHGKRPERAALLHDGNALVRAAARAGMAGETDPLGLWDMPPHGTL